MQQRDAVEDLDVQPVGASGAPVLPERVAQSRLGLHVLEVGATRERGLHRAQPEVAPTRTARHGCATRRRRGQERSDGATRSHAEHGFILPQIGCDASVPDVLDADLVPLRELGVGARVGVRPRSRRRVPLQRPPDDRGRAGREHPGRDRRARGDDRARGDERARRRSSRRRARPSRWRRGTPLRAARRARRSCGATVDARRRCRW